MKALVLNLARETERMAFQAAQLARLGIAYERFAAVTPQTLTPPADDAYWARLERPMRPAEMAAFATHRAAWARIAAGDGPELVLEDDAFLMPGAPAFLDSIETLERVERVTLETRGRRKLVACAAHHRAPMRRLWQDRSGAAAYVLWPTGARKLLARSARHPGLADGVLCAAYEVSVWQADPALAIQIDQCAHYALTPPIAVRSTIAEVERPGYAEMSPMERRAYRLRRFCEQLRMAMHFVRRTGGSELREIDLALPDGAPPISRSQ